MAGREYPLERTRNIGIMAHIDAGKTTLYSVTIIFSSGTIPFIAVTTNFLLMSADSFFKWDFM